MTTVTETVNAWFTTKPNSATGHESAIRLHIRPASGAIDLAMSDDGAQRRVNAWRDAGNGVGLLQRCMMILQAARGVTA